MFTRQLLPVCSLKLTPKRLTDVSLKSFEIYVCIYNILLYIVIFQSVQLTGDNGNA